MFLFKGGQAAEKGAYWKADTGKKIFLKDNGFLPGDGRERYFKLPESYLLIPLFLLALALSMAFPYGMGVVMFAVLYVLYKILFSLSVGIEKLLGNLLSTLWFRYKPNLSFFSGRPKKPKRRERKEKGKEG